jgi:MraZ protein
MAVFAAADQFECDKQGRIVLSQRLRNHAAIKTKAVLTGDLNTFTIWNPKTYEDSRSKDDASILSNLGKLGL